MFNHVVVIIVVHLITLSHAQVAGYQPTPIKHVILTPQNRDSQGATIDDTISTQSEVTRSSTEWTIDSTSEDTWHLLVELDSSWGFHPTRESILEISIEGNYGAGFEDIAVAFMVPNVNEYFATRYYMDNGGAISRMSPVCDNTDPYSQSLMNGNLATILSGSASTRRDNLELTTCVINPCSSMLPSGQDNAMPLNLTLINNPIDDSLLFEYQGTGSSGILQQCGMNEAFTSSQGLQIYFAVVKTGGNQEMTVTSFNIKYSYDLTWDPTEDPTEIPTRSPTPAPTKQPTDLPTRSPTPATTKQPTNQPSDSPTPAPTGQPTNPPTDITKTPSEDPTSSPTGSFYAQCTVLQPSFFQTYSTFNSRFIKKTLPI